MVVFRSIFVLSLIFMASLAQANSMAELDNALKEAKGQVVYLDFWASWCGPCRKSFPWLNAMQAKYQAQNFKVISVNVDTDRGAAEKFLQALPAHFSVIYDPKGKIARKFKLKGMPSSYLINKQGEVVSAHVGFIDNKKSQYENEIIQLTKQK
jgi:thiol-disulfide isomerase/thioredoxin